MKKRVAAVLALAVTAAIGVSAPAAGSGDPLYVDINPVGTPVCPPPTPAGHCASEQVVSVNGVLGPALGDAICTPQNETRLFGGANYPGASQITICRQPYTGP